MTSNIVAQFEDLYSKWSLHDKVGKDAQLAEMMGGCTRVISVPCHELWQKGLARSRSVDSKLESLSVMPET